MSDAVGQRAKRFGETLVKSRQTAGLSQLALAAEVGSTQSTISAWERGESEPPPDIVFELERAFGMVPGELSQFLGYKPIVVEDSLIEAQIGDTGYTLSAIARDRALSAYKRQLLLDIYKTMLEN